ncbi:MAG: Hpt domain-containing protein [Bacteroidia bacterium]
MLDHFALKPIKPNELIQEIVTQSEGAKLAKNQKMNYRIIDIEHIKSFTGGDSVFIRQLVDIFLKRTPEYMDELKDAVNKKQWEVIKTMAHKVKPTFTYVGMAEFTDKVGAIEDYAIKKDISTIESILDEVWDDCQLAFDEFEHFVKNMEE